MAPNGILLGKPQDQAHNDQVDAWSASFRLRLFRPVYGYAYGQWNANMKRMGKEPAEDVKRRLVAACREVGLTVSSCEHAPHP